MDATAVSAARGMAVPRVRPRHVALVALFFGGFQALMPVVGWLVGSGLGRWWRPGTTGLPSSCSRASARRCSGSPVESKAATPPSDEELFGLRVMLLLAVATSIDALAVGVTLPMLDAPFGLSIATIGITTAILSAVGLLVGRRAGAMFGRRLDALGGLLLIGIGAMILVEHLGAR